MSVILGRNCFRSAKVLKNVIYLNNPLGGTVCTVEPRTDGVGGAKPYQRAKLFVRFSLFYCLF
jgi:hypothetical protein